MQRNTKIAFIGLLSSPTTLVKGMLGLIGFMLLVCCHKFSNQPLEQPLSGAEKSVVYRKIPDRLINLKIEKMGDNSFLHTFFDIPLSSILGSNLVIKEEINFNGKFTFKESPILKELADSEQALMEVLMTPKLTEDKKNYFTPKSRIYLNEDYEFETQIMADQSYELIFNPAGKNNMPPVDFLVEEDSKGFYREFPVPHDFVQVMGEIIDGGEQKIFANENIEVGIYCGQRLVSSLSHLDKAGKFNLKMLLDKKGMECKNLYLKTSCDDTFFMCPKLTKKIKLKYNQKKYDLGMIIIENFVKPFEVTVKAVAENSPFKEGFTMVLKTTVDPVELYYSVNFAESEDSVISQIYEGTYDIAIIPSADSSYALKILEAVELKHDESPQEIVANLEKKSQLVANVMTHDGKPLSNATLELSRIGKEDSFATENIFDEDLLTTLVSTNNAGFVCQHDYGYDTNENSQCNKLLLNPGRYAAHVIPPLGTNTPHSYYEFDFPSNNQIGIIVKKPVKIGGKLVAPSGKPLGNFFISAYDFLDSNPPQSRILSSTVTQEDGSFELLFSP